GGGGCARPALPDGGGRGADRGDPIAGRAPPAHRPPPRPAHAEPLAPLSSARLLRTETEVVLFGGGERRRPCRTPSSATLRTIGRRRSPSCARSSANSATTV